MLRCICTGTLVIAGTAVANPQLALMGAGRCEDPHLLRRIEGVQEILRAKLGDVLIGPAEIARKIAAVRTVEEVDARIEAAQAHYYQGEHSIAERALLASVSEIDLLPPGDASWDVRLKAELALALVLRAKNRLAEADECFRRILRLAPGHALDPDLYAPSTRARFERVRREVERARRFTLSVRSNPSEADVFVDGKPIHSKTPLSLELPAGRYSVRVSDAASVSFARSIDLTSDASLAVDLLLDSAVRVLPFPCLSHGSDGGAAVASAENLGSLIGAEQVFVVQSEDSEGRPPPVRALLVQVDGGRRIRGATVFLPFGADAGGLVLELVDFVLSGRRGPHIHEDGIPALMTQSLRPEQDVTPRLLTVDSAPARPDGRSWKTRAGLASVGLGATAVAVGVAFQICSASSWSEFYRFYADGSVPSADDLSRVQLLRKRAISQHSAAVFAIAGGTFALATGSLLVIADGRRASRSTSVAVSVSPGAILLVATVP